MISKKDKYLANAQKYLERGQTEKALAEFDKVVHEDPKDTRTWLKMAELHAKRGANDRATEIYVKTAELYTEQGFFQKAVAVYKNVLKLAPGSVQVHFKLADLFKQLGLLSDAMQQYELAAAVHLKEGRTAEALDSLRQIVEMQPDNIVSRIKLAEAAVQAGSNDEAVREFARAAEQLKGQGRTDEYLKVAERLLFYQPDNLGLSRELAEAYIARNNARFALPKLQACFKADPRDPTTLSLLARAFEQLGQTQKAVQVLKELAKVCHDQGRNAQRNEAVRKVMALEPGDAEAAELAGRWGLTGAGTNVGARPGTFAGASGSQVSQLRGPGTFAGAKSGFGAVPGSTGGGSRPGTGTGTSPGGTGEMTGIREENADLQRIIAETDVFVKYGLLERAADHIRRVFEIKPKHVVAREKLVAVLVQLGRISEAVAELETVAEQLASSKPEDAAEFARRALALDPRSVRARALIEHMEAGTPPPRAEVPEPVAASASDSAEIEVDIGEVSAVEDDSSPEIEIGREPSRTTGASVPAGQEAGPPSPGHEVPAPTFEDEVSSPLLEVIGSEVSPTAAVADEASAEEVEMEAGSSDELVDARDELPELEFAQAQVTAAGEFERDGKTPTSGAIQTDDLTGLEPDEMDAERTVFADSAVPVTVARDRLATPVPGEGGFDPDLVAELDEVSFFLSQGMIDEARARLLELGDRFPGNGLVAEKAAEVEAAAAGADVRGAIPTGPDEPGAAAPVRGKAAPRVVVQDGDAADVGTHKDLGIAYQQMGLHDAAITEFNFLLLDPRHEVFGLQMIGECHEQKGSLTDAVISYKKALNADQVTEQETLRLYYSLASAYERLDDAAEALYFFEKVVKRDAGYSDVQARMKALKARKAGGDKKGGGGGGGPGASTTDEFDAAFDSLLVEDDE